MSEPARFDPELVRDGWVGSVPPDARHEVKYVAAALRYEEIRQWVKLHRYGFHTAYPPRRVNNVYFDTPDLFTYRENLQGASWRSKVRVRWYGESPAPERSTLEVKRRRNMFGWKLSFPTGPLDLAHETWRQTRARIRKQLPPAGKVWLDAHSMAILVNRYEREYFVSPDGKVRVTLDRRQAVYDQRFDPHPNLTRRSNLPDTLVLEIKFSRSDRELGSDVMRGIPIRVSRNSKYVIGVQSLIGPQ